MDIEFGGFEDILEALREKAIELDRAIQRGIQKGGKEIQAECKAQCPVKTGELRNHIIEQTSGSDGHYTSEIGPTKYYGIYVEMGTGIYTDNGRKTPWCYQDEDGAWHTTRGQKPQPYMEPGFEAGKDKALDILTEEVRKSIN